MALPNIDDERIKYFTATWTGLVSLIDSILDLDDEPDLDSIGGTITFFINVNTPLLFAEPNPFVLWPARRTVFLDQGQMSTRLVSDESDSAPMVWRWIARFNVSYKGIVISIPSAIFMAGADSTVDLTSFIGMPASL